MQVVRPGATAFSACASAWERTSRAPNRWRALALVGATCMAVHTPIASAQPSSLTGRISGKVVDEATGITIVAELTLTPSQRLSRSDSAGHFVFNGIAAGSYVVRARALGYSLVAVSAQLRDGENASVTLSLRAAPVTLRPMQTIARSAERERFDDLVPGLVSVGTAELSRLPAIGDGDIVRAASLLPGVSARNDFSAGLNVRGGEADQNLVLLDGNDQLMCRGNIF